VISGFPGNRVDAKRAGMIPIIVFFMWGSLGVSKLCPKI
jgi:hypothetical protein